ncbi:MAG: shikimate kinase [Bacteroidales bacterium]|nr:shikimate kinase [Bacteroidales bacterium]
MKPIFIIGYMGCGKSTIGRAVSRLTGMTFIDLDLYIETRYHSSVRQIFASQGEDAFRDLERRMLHEVGEFEDVLIACGGGTPCFFDNMEYMNTHGTTVWLDTSLGKLFTRLKRGRHKRPLIAQKDDEELKAFIVEALDKRRPFYSKATQRFCGDLLENEAEVDATAQRFIQEVLS